MVVTCALSQATTAALLPLPDRENDDAFLEQQVYAGSDWSSAKAKGKQVQVNSQILFLVDNPPGRPRAHRARWFDRSLP